MDPRHAFVRWVTLIVALAGIVGVAYWNAGHAPYSRDSLPLSPRELSEIARGLIVDLGYWSHLPAHLRHKYPEHGVEMTFPTHDSDVAHGFRYDVRLIESRRKQADLQSPDERPSVIEYWYRQSPVALAPSTSLEVTDTDPPSVTPGAIDVVLDPAGRLQLFHLIVPQFEGSRCISSKRLSPFLCEVRDIRHPAAGETRPVEWGFLLSLAGLEEAELTETDPMWVPATFCDHRVAWSGRYSGQTEPDVRVEGCEYGGRIVFFRIVHPWDLAERERHQPELGSPAAHGMWLVGLLAIALWGARRNLRRKTADVKGALRLGLFVAVVSVLGWLLAVQSLQISQWSESAASREFGVALLQGPLVALAYLAIEPYIRRRRPAFVATLRRLTTGRILDPVLGKHVLLGASVAVVIHVVYVAVRHFHWIQVPNWSDALPPLPADRWHEALRVLFDGQSDAFLGAFVLSLGFVLLRNLLRRDWLTFVACVGLPAAIFLIHWSPELAWPLAWVIAAASGYAFCLVLGGFVAVLVALLVVNMAESLALTLDPPAWYGSSSIVTLAALAAFPFLGFLASFRAETRDPDLEDLPTPKSAEREAPAPRKCPHCGVVLDTEAGADLRSVEGEAWRIQCTHCGEDLPTEFFDCSAPPG